MLILQVFDFFNPKVFDFKMKGSPSYECVSFVRSSAKPKRANGRNGGRGDFLAHPTDCT